MKQCRRSCKIIINESFYISGEIAELILKNKKYKKSLFIENNPGTCMIESNVKSHTL